MAKKFDIKKIGMKAAGLGAGAVAAGLVNKVLPNFNPKLRSALKIAAGVILPELAPKQDLIGHAGDGMVAVGVLELVQQFAPGMVSGFDDAVAGEYVTDSGFESEYPGVSAVNDDESLGANDEENY